MGSAIPRITRSLCNLTAVADSRQLLVISDSRSPVPAANVARQPPIVELAAACRRR